MKLKQLINCSLLFLIFTYSCEETQKKVNYYSYSAIQSSYFGKENIELMLLDKKHQLVDSVLYNKINWKNKVLTDSILLNTSNEKILIYEWRVEGDQFISYSKKDDTIGFIIIAFTGIDMTELYLLKDKKFENIYLEIVKDDNFILNKLNSKMPDFKE